MYSTRSRLLLAIVGALVFAACSGGSSGGTQPEGKLSIAYTGLTTKVGQDVALVAHLENASGDVSWSLNGVGGLSATTGNEIVYQATAAGTATVTASAAGLTAGVTVAVQPGGGGGGGTTTTVTGLVLDVTGDPIVNQAIFVLGMPSSLTSTDGTGHFTIAGVTAPYDLAMVIDATNRVFVYRGLTRTDPTLYANIQPDQTNEPAEATVLTGATVGGDATPAGDLQAVRFFSPDVNPTLNPGSETSTLPAIPGPYSLAVSWNGPLVTTGTLVGVQVRSDPGTGAPLDYWYAAQPKVTLMGNQPTLAGPPLAFMPVATANTEGDIATEPNYKVDAKFVGLSFEGGAFFFPIFTDVLSIGQPNFKYIAPDIANTTSQVCASGVNTVPLLPGRSVTCLDALAPESSGAMLNVLAAPQPFAPANGANAVTAATPFAWSTFTGGVYMVTIEPAAAGNPTYFIFTAGTSTTVPDLSLVGLAFGGGVYDWDVVGLAPFATLDAFTAGIPAAATILLNQGSAPPVPNASVGIGQTYTFSH